MKPQLREERAFTVSTYYRAHCSYSLSLSQRVAGEYIYIYIYSFTRNGSTPSRSRTIKHSPSCHVITRFCFACAVAGPKSMSRRIVYGRQIYFTPVAAHALRMVLYNSQRFVACLRRARRGDGMDNGPGVHAAMIHI